jgi:hypothetical protein
MRRPHSDKQHQLITYEGSVAAFCGRRWGKTDGNEQRIYYHMQKNPGLYWWVGLSWQSASMKRAWRAVTRTARKIYKELNLDPRNYINKTNHEIKIPYLGEIWFRTADNPPSLAGEGIQGAVVDEFTLMQEIVWNEYLRATLLDYGGWVSFSGVPKGMNWASKIWHNAADLNGWMQLHATSYENPTINKRLIDEIKETETQRIFEQEYLAKIIAGEGAVFRNIYACMKAPLDVKPEDHAGHEIVSGVDWAQQVDFTAISAVCRNCRMEVARDRFNQIDYHVQRDRIRTLCETWRVSKILVELNSIGKPNFEELQRDGLPVMGFNTTAQSKPELIENLALCLEKQEIQWQDDQTWTGELEAYERKVSATGRSQYSAPSGLNDDTVIARALAARLITSGAFILFEV